MNSTFRAAAGVALGFSAVLAFAGSAMADDPATGCVRQDSGYAAPAVECVLPTPASRSEVLGAEPNVVTAVRSDVLSATGTNVEPMLLLAGGLVVVGAGVVGGIAVARRRHAD